MCVCVCVLIYDTCESDVTHPSICVSCGCVCAHVYVLQSLSPRYIFIHVQSLWDLTGKSAILVQSALL